MKKEKTFTSTSASSKALIVLLSKKEHNAEFIKRACSQANELFALLVVDTAVMPGQFGFAASEIAQGNALMQEIKRLAKENKTQCNDIIEWGDTVSKIVHFTQLQKIGKVFLVKQENQFFKKLVKELREKTDAEIECIEVREA